VRGLTSISNREQSEPPRGRRVAADSSDDVRSRPDAALKIGACETAYLQFSAIVSTGPLLQIDNGGLGLRPPQQFRRRRREPSVI
jgi:hypothetical protein